MAVACGGMKPDHFSEGCNKNSMYHFHRDKGSFLFLLALVYMCVVYRDVFNETWATRANLDQQRTVRKEKKMEKLWRMLPSVT